MNQSQERFCRHIEQYNEGYTYVGETLILCPVYEIGINVLERTESKLPYIYEIVLKLVNTGINKVTDLCHWLGLEEGILSEIISDMAATLMLVDVSQACITLTPKGKQALGSLKLIEMQKSQLNEIYVNAISGSVMEDPPARLMPSPPPKPYMFLDRQHNLNLSFLNDRFETLANIHQGKKRSDLEYYSKTLFRLLSITYQELHYEAMSAQIYVHNGTKNIIVHFPYNRDFDYPSVVYQQIQAKTNGAAWLFERDTNNKRLLPAPIWQTGSFAQSLANLVEQYHSFQSGEATEMTYVSAYCSNRMLLSGEIDDLLFSLDTYKTKLLIIMSSHILRYLTDDTLIDNWIPILGNLRVCIYYSQPENEREKGQLDTATENLFRKIPESKKNFISIREVDDRYDRTVIIANPGFVIGSRFEYIPCFTGDFLLKEVSCISFDPSYISKWSDLISKYIE